VLKTDVLGLRVVGWLGCRLRQRRFVLSEREIEHDGEGVDDAVEGLALGVPDRQGLNTVLAQELRRLLDRGLAVAVDQRSVVELVHDGAERRRLECRAIAVVRGRHVWMSGVGTSRASAPAFLFARTRRWNSAVDFAWPPSAASAAVRPD
jgi:hypothetical protein